MDLDEQKPGRFLNTARRGGPNFLGDPLVAKKKKRGQ